MPVPTSISQLSTTASLNSPDGAVDVPSSIDDYQRAHAAFIAQLYANTVAAATVIVPSATTTDIGAAASENVDISGNTTITGFGTVAEGINRKGRFTDVLTLTHNATSLILPGNANITTAANDRYEARSLGSGNWIVTKYVYANGSVISATNATNATNAIAAPTEANNLVRAADLQVQSATAFTTGGTSTAFTLTPTPAIAAYTAGMEFDVTFNAASGASPTLAINGIATPPNLVKQISNGTYANISTGDIPANHRSPVVLLSATQALVRKLPPMTGYGVGEGGSVTQLTSKATAVTLNKRSGKITLNNAALAANTTVVFQINNSFITVNSLMLVTFADGNGVNYNVWAYAYAAGSVQIAVRNISAGSLSDALVLTFAVIDGATS